ncbi:MAG: hypothetical protein F4X25_01600 [Chloroflexi bacterium]|nr:hypothetical protein [Chloroflexota bacterium]
MVDLADYRVGRPEAEQPGAEDQQEGGAGQVPCVPSQAPALAQREQQADRQRQDDEREDVQPQCAHQPVAGLRHDAGQGEQERQQRHREDDERGAGDLGAQDAPHDRSRGRALRGTA